jgi:hypothetical protein
VSGAGVQRAQGQEFAATEDLSPRSLSWWQWRLQRGDEEGQARCEEEAERRTKSGRAMSFVPVVVRPSHPVGNSAMDRSARRDSRSGFRGLR